MIKHYPYRFKTKDEFIKEYGVRFWRTANRESDIIFVKEMEHLFGKIYPFVVDLQKYDIDQRLPNLDNMFNRHVNMNNWKWVICKFMLTKNEFIPNYKPTKKIERIL